jgi:hypothetical protein
MKPQSSLQETLRAGDPARDASLDAAQVAQLRARLADALEQSAPSPLFPWRAIWAGCALAALALVLALRAPQAPAPADGARAAQGASANLKDQQLQFETSDGVRIVWVLSPNVPL